MKLLFLFIFSFKIFSAEVEAPISEILQLKKNESMPLEVVRKYSSRHIARTLIHRLNLNQYQYEKRVSFPNMNLEKVQVGLFFNSKILKNLLVDGVRNQHQTGTGSGAVGGWAKNKRLRMELDFLKVEFPKEIPEQYRDKYFSILPKYAFLFPKIEELLVSLVYGDMGIILQPKVFQRASFSLRDSLVRGFSGTMQAITPATIAYFEEAMKDRIIKKKSDYFEAQIYGRLDFSDVKYFLINLEKSKSIEYKKNIIDKILELGFKIRFFSILRANSTEEKASDYQVVKLTTRFLRPKMLLENFLKEFKGKRKLLDPLYEIDQEVNLDRYLIHQSENETPIVFRPIIYPMFEYEYFFKKKDISFFEKTKKLITLKEDKNNYDQLLEEILDYVFSLSEINLKLNLPKKLEHLGEMVYFDKFTEHELNLKNYKTIYYGRYLLLKLAHQGLRRFSPSRLVYKDYLKD